HDRVAIVFKRPLPYLYLAPASLGVAGIPYHVADALPLAAEPVVTTVDLIVDAVETEFSRDSLVALLRSPHLDFDAGDAEAFRRSISEMNRGLSDCRYLGGTDRLEAFAASPKNPKPAGAETALAAALSAARELAPLRQQRPASEQLRDLTAFLKKHFRRLDRQDPFAN